MKYQYTIALKDGSKKYCNLSGLPEHVRIDCEVWDGENYLGSLSHKSLIFIMVNILDYILKDNPPAQIDESIFKRIEQINAWISDDSFALPQFELLMENKHIIGNSILSLFSSIAYRFINRGYGLMDEAYGNIFLEGWFEIWFSDAVLGAIKYINLSIYHYSGLSLPTYTAPSKTSIGTNNLVILAALELCILSARIKNITAFNAKNIVAVIFSFFGINYFANKIMKKAEEKERLRQGEFIIEFLKSGKHLFMV